MLVTLALITALTQRAAGFETSARAQQYVLASHNVLRSFVEETKASVEELKSRHAELQSADKHSASLQSSGLCAPIFSTIFDCNSNTCSSCLSNHPNSNWVWVGYCTNQTTANLLSTGWGTRFGNTDCNTAINSRSYTTTCTSLSGTTNSECNSTIVGLGNQRSITLQRGDFSIESSVTLLNAQTGAFDGFTSFYGSLSGRFVTFFLSTGFESLASGPASIYQGASYIVVPAGGFTSSSVRITGSNSFVVYDSGFAYTASSFASGVGATTSYSGVSFDDWKNATVTGLTELGSGADKNITATLCTTQSAPQACLEMVIGASDLTVDGLTVSNLASKVNVYVNGISYSGSDDSYGIRVIAISSSYSGTVIAGNTGNSANEFSETFGTAYLITEDTVKASTAAITQANQGSATSVIVTRNAQPLTSSNGAECGFSSGDWYGTSVTSGGVTYNNAKEFFAGQNMGTMTCSFFSFAAADANDDNYLWDPVLGIDGDAAVAATSSNTDSSTSDNTGVIVGSVVGGIVGLGLIAGGIFFFMRRKSASPGDDVGAANL